MSRGLRPAADVTTLVDVLCWRAQQQPDDPAFAFLTDGEQATDTVSYAELDRRARQIAQALLQVGSRGDRVMLIYPPGIEYVAGFFGCLYAGMIAIPTYPPRLHRIDARLQAIVSDAQPQIALTTHEIHASLAARFVHTPELAALRWINSEAMTAPAHAEWRRPRVNAQSLAFLQYTSGSTATPRGVMLSHGNLLHNLATIHAAFEVNEDSRGVIWLPPYHDMGLIGGILQPLYGGFPVTHMAPVAFLQRPMRWLQAIARTRATISGGPNSAFAYCAAKVTQDELATLDLSSWKLAFIGAEPIHAATLQQFAQKFAPAGFRINAFYPCYGLAENTLMVSGAALDAAPVTLTLRRDQLQQRWVEPVADTAVPATAVTSCGRVQGGQIVRIVDPVSGTRCAPQRVGEIWIRGASVAQGYWNQPENSLATFGARLPGEDPVPFLRTGDLGFLHNDALFVTGRLKELIIIRGRNFYPQDIEHAVQQAVPEAQTDAGAAFGIEIDGEERLIVVQELTRQARHAVTPALVGKMRAAIALAHDVRADEIVLIKPGSLPKTSSGKIQRRQCQALYLAGALEVIHASALAPSEETAATSRASLQAANPDERQTTLLHLVRARLSAHLGVPVDQISAAASPAALGLDSLAAVEFSHAIERELQVELSAVQWLDGRSLTQIAAQIAASLENALPAPILPARNITPPASRPSHPSFMTTSQPINGQTFALSSAQERMWFLDQLDPGSPIYNISGALHLEGPLDIAALRDSLNHVLQRHETLRTRFVAVGGVPRAIVDEAILLELTVVNAPSAQAAQALAAEEARRTFDLTQAPLIRTLLIRTQDQDHLLTLTIHHIVSDGWSLAVLMRELNALYVQLVNAGEARLPALPLQYVDYAQWQRESLANDDANAAHIAWWKDKLGGRVPVLDLPADRTRPPYPTQSGDVHTFVIPAALAARARELARAEGVTLFMLFTALFQTQLFRYTGQSDQWIGTPVANRPRSELEGLIGLFVNTLVLRNDLSGDPEFRVLLQRVKDSAVGAFSHQAMPFDRLLELTEAGRNTSHSPLFQVMISQQPPVPAARMEQVRATPIQLTTHTAKFDLTLFFEDRSDSIDCAIEFNTDIFEASTIARFAGHFQHLVAAVARDPAQQLSELALLDERERARVVHDWNQAVRRTYPAGGLMHDMFEAQTAQTPNHIALLHLGQPMTYAELNARANHLARMLQSRGVGPDVFVGVCMDRCPDLIIALLAVLKSGAAYVPLDPAYPLERLEFMLRDTAATLLITKQALGLQLATPDIDVLHIETLPASTVAAAQDNPAPRATPEHLGYVIYTSGSTGRPKGVALTHRGAVTFLNWAREVFAAEELSRTLAATSVCFDLSVFEIFLPLSVGATVVLVDNALGLINLEASTGVTLVNTVPSAMTELVRLGGVPASVRTINLAGEPLPRMLVDAIYATGTVSRVYNLYGPSEDTTYSTVALIPRDETRAPLIGRPIANTQAYILDAQLRPQPIGIPGELFLGGHGLARGYHARPALTAEKFIPDPFSTTSGGRLYRTGDIARWRPDGQIDFLGRRDHQVKIRGFRIELGEIEAVLARHDAIKDCTVMARTDPRGDPQIVAYVVGKSSQPGDDAVLRGHLRASLPEFMVPAAIVWLAALPLSPNGKVDRGALPAPDLQARLQASFVAARTPVEEKLAEIWCTVLGVSQVGVNDSFFELGGHSLLATQIIARIRETYGVELPLRGLFETPTIAALARALGAGATPVQRSEPDAIRIVPRARKAAADRAADLMSELDQLSDEEIRELLARRANRKN